jgi:predicted RNA-binding Zn-ribbon protein involved in translation (DUF1610 family)
MSAYRSAEPCPQCKSGTTTSEGECLSCGALWGSAFLCPHCGVHARTEADRLVGTACAKCKIARVARPLPKEAYGRLLELVRFYRLWPARAAAYIPVLAVIVALVAAGTSVYVKSTARNERQSFIAERGTTVGAPTTTFADLLPEAPMAFVGGLGIVGAIGIAVFLGVAATFRQRVRREARRLTALE